MRSNILICGLGNYGIQYEKTRHNAGFLCVDKINSVLENCKKKDEFSKQLECMITIGNIKSCNITTIKPYTYMNLSGQSLIKVFNFYKDFTKVIIIQDEIDLALGRVKITNSKSPAGHNGIKSINQHFQKDYFRIRIGVGRPENESIPVSDFVLSSFKKEELQIIDETFDKINDNILEIITIEDSKVSELNKVFI
jgi:PTH1 family peptidyl-tRNA hydrolase